VIKKKPVKRNARIHDIKEFKIVQSFGAISCQDSLSFLKKLNRGVLKTRVYGSVISSAKSLSQELVNETIFLMVFLNAIPFGILKMISKVYWSFLRSRNLDLLNQSALPNEYFRNKRQELPWPI